MSLTLNMPLLRSLGKNIFINWSKIIKLCYHNVNIFSFALNARKRSHFAAGGITLYFDCSSYMPKITSIFSSQCILSGGRTIFLKGTNLNIGNMEYAVELTYLDVVKSQVPVGCTM